ncbi:helix-turn-helix domain-containing protein [Pasteurella multocida]|uniref:helix-turn-helix domain-containing protein n=1 Tax=Pasteurella multocida TaxID=747 RepID=UPI000DC21509|nr:helix-turn-helix transcriptional regulator [Pasteurella multocida]MCL7758068.1 helix-turn-helix transcriptional regulator [Pasteurella multocida]MCL7841652.1 helix-turn-helix transcriptional regulator [Pasteurella multocida]MCT8984060.1 helix-turn-helix transcriptional regulator [Pasteurella multocida]MDG2541011.1 helix-turn-helix transcriptional regulator [Pasteurella multocida]MDY0670103.1 helix-turn-helix transcriptional regulator [Pasteurella multocida]
MSIGARIKQLQRELGFTSSEKFAEVLDKTTASRINDIVRGKQKLPDDLMFELITKFNVNANWIIAGVGDIFIKNIPNISNDETINLTKEEESLLDDFRNMNDQGKTAVKTTARAMAEQELFKNSKVG